MHILVLTWNSHGASTLPSFSTSADLILVSMQECYSPPTKTLQSHPYHTRYSLCGLQTLIWSKQPLKTSAIKIGLGKAHFINKGFIAVNISNDIMHVNAHLAAHPENNGLRMKQVESILRYCASFPFTTFILSGDLNFRCVGGEDQGRIFLDSYEMFREHEIKFKPTYRYRKSSIDLRREPSFCDRIFVASGGSAELERYYSLSTVILSDHKPVVLLMKLTGARNSLRFDGMTARNVIVAELVTSIYNGAWKSRKYFISVLLILALLYSFKLLGVQ